MYLWVMHVSLDWYMDKWGRCMSNVCVWVEVWNSGGNICVDNLDCFKSTIFSTLWNAVWFLIS